VSLESRALVIDAILVSGYAWYMQISSDDKTPPGRFFESPGGRGPRVSEIVFRHAERRDRGALEEILAHNGLPSRDIGEHLPRFVLARRAEETVGAVGLEVRGSEGLLRSLVVVAAERGRGIARELCARIESLARLEGVGTLYLLTETAAGFFARLGFSPVERSRAPESIQATEEFRHLCPSSAVCMRKELTGGERHDRPS
jgi:amino-acid N-acetyltransferase